MLLCCKFADRYSYPLVDTHSQTIPNFVIMKQENRSLKISQVAAKTAIRVFIIILFFGLLPFIAGNDAMQARMQTTHLVIPNKWTLIFPAILFLGFLALAIICKKRKYQVPDFNWLLVLNTMILLAYMIMLYSRIFKAIIV